MIPGTNEMSEVNESLGGYLRRSREGKSVSIEQVAYATRISLKMLRALEEDDHTALPASTFVRGYLQAYAKYVRIDTQDLLLRYQHHLATAPDAKRGAIRSHYLYVRERYQEKRRLVLVIVLFATMLSVAGAYFFLKTQREKHKRLARTAEQIQKGEEPRPTPAVVLEAPPVKSAERADARDKPAEKAAEKPAQEKAEKKPDTALATRLLEPTKAPPPPAPTSPVITDTGVKAPSTGLTDASPAPGGPLEQKNFQLMLKAAEDVWFRFQTDEDEVKDLTLRSGKTMVLRANKVIKIFSGNLGAFKAVLNGQEIASLARVKGIKSVVLPESEAGNYTLPLFPQFQARTAVLKVSPEADNASRPAETPPASEHPRSPPDHDDAATPSPN